MREPQKWPVTEHGPYAWKASDAGVWEGLAALPENWDSYGAHPVPKAALLKAQEWAARFESAGFPVPHVCPACDGTIYFHWFEDGFNIELTVNNDYESILDEQFAHHPNRQRAEECLREREAYVARQSLPAPLVAEEPLREPTDGRVNGEI